VSGGVYLDEDDKREPLTRRRIVEAALRLVDEDGLEALTMRRLGTELGFEAMPLYRHFPNKAALLDYLIEAVWAEMELPSSGGIRGRRSRSSPVPSAAWPTLTQRLSGACRPPSHPPGGDEAG
jgi:AcrR family transcriptional regulator